MIESTIKNYIINNFRVNKMGKKFKVPKIKRMSLADPRLKVSHIITNYLLSNWVVLLGFLQHYFDQHFSSL